ncbi:hypothetical protein PR048_033751 [Dryococelus australis]|uniref:Uncharacterized protein n=1 Tax=Dryococelus australis TaxID=614101 RepID=A0ABQ9G0C6_9NEOP|nr:hypothetical protein PR048_033751 [Dryococelus australis]
MWWRSQTFQELLLDIPMPGGREPGSIRVGSQQCHHASMCLSDAGKRRYREDGSKKTWFAEWRLVHRARLNVMPLNGAYHGRGQHGGAPPTGCPAGPGDPAESEPTSTSLLRLYLVLNETHRTALLVAATVPFDNRYVGLEWARWEKFHKNQVVLNQLRICGFQAEMEAIIVGSLGSWDPANNRVLS